MAASKVSGPKCATCKLWRQREDQPILGYCHRHAPLTVTERSEVRDGMVVRPIHDVRAVRVQTAAEDFCGDHRS